ncbi:hypothetical protein HYW11_03005, partial [Candidatus Peregrinibacteria bacterium]|nr:hypothetical protein [Candidatus Peregrinibacteria bacterium]
PAGRQALPLGRGKQETPADHIRNVLKYRNIHLSDGWTGCVICPSSVDPAVAGYSAREDPKIEGAVQSILSLPTHPTMTNEKATDLITHLTDVHQQER